MYAKKIVNGVETNAVPERNGGSSFFRLSKGDNYLQLKAATILKMELHVKCNLHHWLAGVAMDFSHCLL